MKDDRRHYHVVPHHHLGWAVKRDGARRVSSCHATQGAAIEAAKVYARKARVEVRIHTARGVLRDSDTYGRESAVRDTRH